MKSILISLSIFASCLVWGQTDMEEGMDNMPLAENTAASVVYSIKGVFQLPEDNCSGNFSSMIYPGGTDAYIRDLKVKFEENIAWNNYAVNGQFSIKLDIDKTGQLTNVDITPKVTNSELFFYDLKEAVKKVNKKWRPAMCNGNAVDSQAVIKIDFSSMTYENVFN